MIDGPRLQLAFLERLADSAHSEGYVLRGSLLTRFWVGASRRQAQDIDLVALFPHDPERTRTELEAIIRSGAAGEIHPEPQFQEIWTESEFPGLRMILNAPGDKPKAESEEKLQVDVGFGDPLAVEPMVLDLGDGRHLNAVTPEIMFGWKLHGLYESDTWWRPKDLADLWLLMKHVPMCEETLRQTIALSFSSRRTPLWKLHRLLDREMGRSSGSRRRWRDLLQSGVCSGVPEDLSEIVAAVATFVSGIVAPMELGRRPVWVDDPKESECEALLEASGDFSRYDWQSGSTYVCERPHRDTFPPPYNAPTVDGCRQRLLRWECRGLTLEGDAVLARPFPRFLPAKDLPEDSAQGAAVTLKLDGSLIFPTRLAPGADEWRWRTRRGPSPIADDAAAFADESPGDYRKLVEDCLAAGQTPLFEWCSRKRLLILDHPVDRLVLTGLRENSSGHLQPPSTVAELGARHGVETAPLLGHIGNDFSLEELRSELATWREREGVVVLTEENRLYKLKAPLYRVLHGAIEGPSFDVSRWLLILAGEEKTLLAAGARRGLDLRPYVEKLNAQIQRLAKLVRSWSQGYTGDRGEFARQLPLEGLAKRWTFEAIDGAEIEPMIRKDLLRSLGERGHWQELMKQINAWEKLSATRDS